MADPVSLNRLSEDEFSKELYTDDLARAASQILNGRSNKWLTQGESKKNLSETLMVDLVGFVAQLIKIAAVWSRGKP